MAYAARYLTLVYEKYSKYPIIIIIGVSTVTTSVASRLAPATTHPYSLEDPCLFWAKRCLLMSSITLSKIEPTERLESLAVVSVFLCSQKLSIKYLDSGSDDSTKTFLYKVAITNVQQLVGGKTEEAEAIQSICDNTENQIKEIKRCMQQEDRTAMLYLDDTSDYLRRQKRKYTMGRQTTLIPDTLSIKYLKSQQSKSTMYNNFIELGNYVKHFQNKNSGRISWKQCFKQDHEEKESSDHGILNK